MLHAIQEIFKSGVEWGGFIYRMGQTVSYAESRRGSRTMTDERRYAPVPPGAVIVGDYHTHTSKPADWDDEDFQPFSGDDVDSRSFNGRAAYHGVLDGNRLWQGRVWRTFAEQLSIP